MLLTNKPTERKPRNSVVLNRLAKYIEAENVAEEISEEAPDEHIDLKRIGVMVSEEFEIDRRSNQKWAETAEKFMNIALQVKEAKSFPWAGASNVKYPLITVAALQFNARSYPEIQNAGNIVKAKIVGSDEGVPQTDQAGQPVVDPQTGAPVWKVEPGAKQGKADRVSGHMSYQLSEEMDGWEEDLDTLLMRIPITGCDFKKVYRDGDQNASDLISGTDVFVNRKVKSLRKAPRITHRVWFYPHEIEERQRDGRWLDDDLKLSTPADADGDGDAPHEFLEQHRRLDLDGDKYGEPYIVTVHKESSKVVRIVANFEEEDVVLDKERVVRIKPREYFVKFGFLPDPNGGFYDIGFGQLLESINASIDTVLNQMIDAGTLQNAGGGFIGSGVRFKSSTVGLSPGVYKTLEASGDDIRNAIVTLDHPGPSATLFQLLGLLIEAARDITGVKDIITGDSGGKVQTATTTLALIEQGLKTFTAIYQRVYRSLKREFKLLYQLNATYLDETAYFNVMDTPKAVARSDYADGEYDICPQADPKAVTDMQRAARANVLLQFKGDPTVDQAEINRRVFAATGQDNIESLMAKPQQPDPRMEAAADLQLQGAQADVEKKVAEAGKTEAEAKEVEARTGKQVLEIADFLRNGPPDLRKLMNQQEKPA